MDTLPILNRVLHGTVNSVVQYIHVSRPYVPPACAGAMDELERLRAEEAQTAHDLVELIGELDGVPRVEAFPYWNVDLNYLDVRFMARFAKEHQEKVIAQMEAALAGTGLAGSVRATLGRILDQKRAHLAVIEEIAAVPDPEVDEELRKKAQPAEAQHVPRPAVG